MKKTYILILFLVSTFAGYSQTDSSLLHQYKLGFKFKEGIYANFQQYKQNSPISKAKIITNIDINRFDFFDVLLQNKTIKVYDNMGEVVEINSSKIWGFCNKSVVYINFNSEFNRIPVIGNISHYIANYTFTEYDPHTSGYNPYQTNYPQTKTELRQYLLDFNTGKIYDFTYKTVEILIMSDTELYDKYIDLSKRKQKKQKFIYIREFNKKHPIYFPK